MRARALFFAAVLVALPAAASERRRLVLVAESSELAHRLRAEAVDLGLDVEVESPTNVAPPAIAQKHAAVGVLRVSAPSTVELWIASGDERPSSYETFRAQPGEGDAFAFRVVEEVRARLTRLHLPDAPEAMRASGADAPAPEIARPVADRRRAPPAIGAGMGTTMASGGMGPALQAAIVLRSPAFAGWRAGVEALLPLAAQTFSAPEGSASVRTYVVAADVEREAWDRPPWSLSLGAGAGGVILTLHADPTLGYVGRDDRLAAAVLFARAHLRSEITAWLSAHATILAGAAAPRPTIRFDGREAAAWGRAFAGGMITLDLNVPDQGHR
jgi:hypothetical protein